MIVNGSRIGAVVFHSPLQCVPGGARRGTEGRGKRDDSIRVLGVVVVHAGECAGYFGSRSRVSLVREYYENYKGGLSLGYGHEGKVGNLASGGYATVEL